MRAYVTGGTGFVGSNIVMVLAGREGATVHCPVHRFVPEGELAYSTEPLDLLDPVATVESVRRFEPDVVIHSMILNDFGLLYRDRRLAWDSYVTTTRTLVDAADEVGAKMILVSTDWVFDGTQAGADEDTPPNPINFYGVMKVAAERVVLERADRGAVARVSGVNGVHWARPTTERAQDCGFGYFVASLVDALGARQEFVVWEGDDINMVATPSLASECGELMARIAERDGADGVFHLCGADATSRMELARLAAEVFELDPALIRSGPPDPESMPGAPIPYDTSLAVGRTAVILDHEPTPVAQLLARFRSELSSGALAMEGP